VDVVELSASQLKTYLGCALRWWLTRVDGWPDPASTAGIAGNVMHTALEQWELGGRVQDSVALYRRAMAARLLAGDLSQAVVLGRSKKTAREDLLLRQVDGERQIIETTAAIRESGLRPAEQPDGRPAVETKFEYETPGGIRVRGFIDVVMTGDNGWLRVRDYKSGRREASPLQLLVYRDAWWRLTGTEIRTGEYFYTKDGHVWDVQLDRWPVGFTDGLFDTMARAIKAGIVLPSPGDGCNLCPVRAHCPIH
jgi:CRISPR/Cas system-associated exonuclease Cas4 (RecB family)